MLTISEGLEKGPPPPIFTLPLLIIAFLVVDQRQRWFLPWWGAGSLGLLALAVAFREVPTYLSFSEGVPELPEERRLDLIFAGAHLLVFLTWIVLFLKKTNQQYWWLWGLAVLQISIGASQSTDGIYGVFLCLYLFLALWTLSVFSLFQGQQQFDRAQQVAESMDGSESQSPPHSRASANALDQGNGFGKQPSQAIGSVQRDPNASWINLRFVWGVLGTALVALFVAVLFFFFIPRHPAIWRRNQTFVDRPIQSTVGFSRNLSLGDIGQILESTKKVMEVQLTDPQTGETLDIEEYARNMGYEEPLFRGMTTIEYRQGQWRTWRAILGGAGADVFLPTGSAARNRYVEQQIHLEPVDSELLFAMPPARFGRMEGSADAIVVERFNDVLKRPDRNRDKAAADYRILSPRLPEKPGAIALRKPQADFIRSFLPEYLKVPPELGGLRRLAVDVAGADKDPRPSDMEMARRMEDYLKVSGGFNYTLRANVDDPTIDPLEDFLFNRKQGHCEYFASALVLMLRSAGIPSRLVSGFKGGTYHPTTGKFVIEERHAHAWVEAFIDDSWVILDPTPAARAESVASVAEEKGSFMNLAVLFRDFWNRFVINLNVGEQRRLLEPLKQLLNNTLAWLRNGRANLTNFFQGPNSLLRSPERWISWQGGVVTFVLLTLISGLVWLSRAMWRLFDRLRSQYFDPEGLARTVAFYERFRRICSANGWTRRSSQTPKEFAFEVRRNLRKTFPQNDGRDFPLALTEAYYEVRYGGKELGKLVLDQLEQDLTRFESQFESPA